MSLEFIAGIGHADHCIISAHHTPVPRRYIFHHIQPECCGGKTVPANLVQLCDNDHYAIHSLLFELKTTGKISRRDNAKRIAVARQGYNACIAAGTVDKIPDEGSA